MDPAKASSIRTETSFDDFSSGSFQNISIITNGSEAELQLTKEEQDHWTDKNLTLKPGARIQHSMSSIYGMDKVVLFGGRDSTGRLDDTWTYDFSLNIWNKLGPSTKPDARERHSMAPVLNDDKAVLFGGYDWSGSSIYYNDTWIYDASEYQWSKLNPSSKPEARASCKMVPIYGSDKFLLFGGSNGVINLVDTWLYDLSDNTWTKKSPAANPIPNWGFDMASIWGTDKAVLFGGFSAGNDIWIYDLSEDKWEKKTPIVKPGNRYSHSMETISGTDKVLMFGGVGGTGDTWIYDVSDNLWSELITSTTPGSRVDHGMAQINGYNRILFFGGNDGTDRDDTWTFNYHLYSKTGHFISAPFDTGYPSSFKTLSWKGDEPIETDILFQIRSASKSEDLVLKNFVGPDGNQSKYYQSSPSSIWQGHDGDRWLEYKVILTMDDFNITPVLNKVSIEYNNLPTSSILSPFNNSYLTINRPAFTWNFNDNDSTNQLAFQVLIDDNISFSDVDFDSSEQNSGINKWNFPSGTSYTKIPDSTWYWKVRTKDDDGDWGSYSTTTKFNIDTIKPLSAITIPGQNSYLNNLVEITGEAVDQGNGSGIYQIEITIQRMNDNQYWTGAAWTHLETWLQVSGGTIWTYDTSMITWNTGLQYNVRSRASDIASNLEHPGPGNTFTFDTQSPSSFIEIPADSSYVNNLDEITGSSEDPGNPEPDYVEISLKRSSDNRFWNRTEWITQEAWLKTTGTDPWSFDSSFVKFDSNAGYVIQSRAVDAAGNIELLGKGNSFIYDDVIPKKLNISINDNASYTNLTQVVLTLDAFDSGSGIYQMAFSVDAVTWTGWEDFNKTKIYTLHGSSGEKFVYVKVKDRAENIRDNAYDSIYLDSKPPHDVSILINEGAQKTNSINVSLDLSAADDASGVYQISFSSDGANWTDWGDFENEKYYELPLGDGIKFVYFKVKDHAGNTATEIASILLNTEAIDDENDNGKKSDKKETEDKKSNSALIIFALIIIVIVVTIFVFLSIRKKREHTKSLKQSEVSDQTPTYAVTKPQTITPTVVVKPEPFKQPTNTTPVTIDVQTFPVPVIEDQHELKKLPSVDNENSGNE